MVSIPALQHRIPSGSLDPRHHTQAFLLGAEEHPESGSEPDGPIRSRSVLADRHVGRRSGRTYETPVILAEVAEGFIAELTYGENVNWYRNVVAAGGCVVVHGRREYRVSSVEPCGAEAGRDAYPTPFRLILKAAGREEF